MTFVSFVEATHRLSIDAKTLHRWLADAQLALQNHPHDGRKKVVSLEHLQELARLHHRQLASASQEVPVPLPSPIPALPADLLSLPEQLCALQTQIAALQQQVADLTRLLQQHEPAPTCSVAPPKPSSTSQQPPKPTLPKPSAPRPRPAASTTAKPPAKPTHVIARVEYGPDGRYVVICPKKGLLPLEPDTEEWFAWIAEQDSFRFVGQSGYFTAHHEWRVPQGAWRAHRHIRNHSYTLRLAPAPELTIAVLEQAAQALQAHLL